MPSGFWDYIHLGRSRTHDDDVDDQVNHNLQAGLFQIASQTCNILVQVNNTNNINFRSNFDDSKNFEKSTSHSRSTMLVDLEQSVVLLQPKSNKSPTPSRGRFHRLSEYKRRLSVSFSTVQT